jgi:hypothetical protein
MSGSSIVSGLSLHNRENHPALDVFTIRFRPNRIVNRAEYPGGSWV